MPSPEQMLELTTWLLGLVEFIMALYILLLNSRHTANRHVSALLLLFGINSFALGQLVIAHNASQAVWATRFLAATSPAVQPGLLLIAIALLKPQWLQISRTGKRRDLWRLVWWLVYALAFLPIVLTLLDVGFGTRLWYTSLAPETYAGGYVQRTAYTMGSLSMFIRIASFYSMPIITFIPLLYIAILDKTITQTTRRLAWVLTGTQAVGLVMQFGLRPLFRPEVGAIVTPAALVFGYAYAAFWQMISERRMQRGRLTVRLTAVILVIALPLIGMMIIFVSTLAGEQIKQDAIERLETINHALGSNVAAWMNSNVDALQQLVIQPDVVSMDAERQKPALAAMASAHDHIYLVSTINLDGVNVARSDDVPPKNYSTQSWFKEIRDGALLAIQVRLDTTSQKPALLIAMPIRDQFDTVVGVAMFANNLTEVVREIQVNKVGESGFAYIVDANNRILAHPDPQFAAELVFTAAPPVVALREGYSGPMEFTDEQGIHWHAYADVLPNTFEYNIEWGVVVQQQEVELTIPLRQFQAVAWLASVIGVLLLGGLASLAIRQALRPIGALTDTATAIAAGDLTRVAPVESEDEISVLANAFNSMTAQIREQISSLGQRVADRTRDLERRTHYLEASTQVAHAAASTLDPQQLLEQAVALINKHFGFYHVSIFLLDEDREWASLHATSGESGQSMRTQKRRIKVGQNTTIGYVASQGEYRIALDVGIDAVVFNNPGLPDTRSEIALPLQARGEILGVLDVQSTEPQAFIDEDVAVLQTLADQVAVAISNAQLFQQAQESLEAERRAYGVQSREVWTELLSARPDLGYYCDASGVTPATERPPRHDDHDDTDLAAIEIPVTVYGGQVIGTINARKPDEAGEWSAEEISLLETLTEQLNVALESARLHQDTQRRAAREHLIGNVTARVRETLDLETMLKTAAQEVRQALDLPEVVIRLTPRVASKDGNGDGKRDDENPSRGRSSDGGNNDD